MPDDQDAKHVAAATAHDGTASDRRVMPNEPLMPLPPPIKLAYSREVTCESVSNLDASFTVDETIQDSPNSVTNNKFDLQREPRRSKKSTNKRRNKNNAKIKAKMEASEVKKEVEDNDVEELVKDKVEHATIEKPAEASAKTEKVIKGKIEITDGSKTEETIGKEDKKYAEWLARKACFTVNSSNEFGEIGAMRGNSNPLGLESLMEALAIQESPETVDRPQIPLPLLIPLTLLQECSDEFINRKHIQFRITFKIERKWELASISMTAQDNSNGKDDAIFSHPSLPTSLDLDKLRLAYNITQGTRSNHKGFKIQSCLRNSIVCDSDLVVNEYLHDNMSTDSTSTINRLEHDVWELREVFKGAQTGLVLLTGYQGRWMDQRGVCIGFEEDEPGAKGVDGGAGVSFRIRDGCSEPLTELLGAVWLARMWYYETGEQEGKKIFKIKNHTENDSFNHHNEPKPAETQKTKEPNTSASSAKTQFFTPQTSTFPKSSNTPTPHPAKPTLTFEPAFANDENSHTTEPYTGPIITALNNNSNPDLTATLENTTCTHDPTTLDPSAALLQFYLANRVPAVQRWGSIELVTEILSVKGLGNKIWEGIGDGNVEDICDDGGGKRDADADADISVSVADSNDGNGNGNSKDKDVGH